MEIEPRETAFEGDEEGDVWLERVGPGAVAQGVVVVVGGPAPVVPVRLRQAVVVKRWLGTDPLPVRAACGEQSAVKALVQTSEPQNVDNALVKKVVKTSVKPVDQQAVKILVTPLFKQVVKIVRC